MKTLRSTRRFHGLLLLAVTSWLFPLTLLSEQSFQSELKYSVRLEKSKMITLRDGIRLATDFYFPVGVGPKLATILIRTPYNKNGHRKINSEAYFFADKGFVVAVQDVRGKFESEGLFVVQATDGDDSNDTIDWLAKQPWSNGKVGTSGCSYLGETQIFQAKRLNPHHAAMIPRGAGAPARFLAIRNGGALEFALVVGWMRESGSTVNFQVPPNTPEQLRTKALDYFRTSPQLEPISYPELWRTLPIADVLEKAKAPPSEWRDFASHDTTDKWWDRFDLLTKDYPVDVPALHVSSWYDYGVAGSLETFNIFRRVAKSEHARANQYIIVSPTDHCSSESATEDTRVGNRPIGDARFGLWDIYARWMDHWLYGVDNGITNMPKVQYFVMGRNRWASANEWPLPGTQFTKFYLHSNGRANSRYGNGWLGTQSPGAETPDHFVYDPATPVPSVGGPLCCTGSPEALPGSFDQSEVEMRSDVLVYSTSTLENGIEVTGPLKAVLFVSSDSTDTDFTVKLVDVYPDGTAYNVQEAILRARYREGFDRQVRMTPDKVYKLVIDMHATSNYFPPGHKIRIEISSSNFPRFDRNLNTGGNNYDETAWRVSTNRVHHSAKYPSHLVLPIQVESDDESDSNR